MTSNDIDLTTMRCTVIAIEDLAPYCDEVRPRDALTQPTEGMRVGGMLRVPSGVEQSAETFCDECA